MAWRSEGHDDDDGNASDDAGTEELGADDLELGSDGEDAEGKKEGKAGVPTQGDFCFFLPSSASCYFHSCPIITGGDNYLEDIRARLRKALSPPSLAPGSSQLCLTTTTAAAEPSGNSSHWRAHLDMDEEVSSDEEAEAALMLKYGIK